MANEKVGFLSKSTESIALDALLKGTTLDIKKLNEVKQAISINNKFRPGLASESVNELRMYVALALLNGNRFESENDEFNKYLAQYRNYLIALCKTTNENLFDKLFKFSEKRFLTAKRDDYVSPKAVNRMFIDWSEEECLIISKLFNNLPNKLY